MYLDRMTKFFAPFDALKDFREAIDSKTETDLF